MRGLLAVSRFIDRGTAFIGKFVAWLVPAAVVISAGNAITRKALHFPAFIDIAAATVWKR